MAPLEFEAEWTGAILSWEDAVMLCNESFEEYLNNLPDDLWDTITILPLHEADQVPRWTLRRETDAVFHGLRRTSNGGLAVLVDLTFEVTIEDLGGDETLTTAIISALKRTATIRAGVICGNCSVFHLGANISTAI